MAKQVVLEEEGVFSFLLQQFFKASMIFQISSVPLREWFVVCDTAVSKTIKS